MGGLEGRTMVGRRTLNCAECGKPIALSCNDPAGRDACYFCAPCYLKKNPAYLKALRERDGDEVPTRR